MRRPPSLSQISLYPVTTITGVIAISASILCWAKPELLGYLVADYRTWPREPWRLATSVLPHVTIFHLVFNLYWLWVFGTAVEQYFRGLRMAAIFLLFAVGASAAEFAFLDGGIGLSGVGYGLFGMLWVMGRRDGRFADAVDRQTIALFVIWFFVCIILTIKRIMPVANIAHGVGLGLGAMLGGCLTTRRRVGRVVGWAGVVAVMVLILMASSVGRPHVNFSPDRGRDLAVAAYRELEAKRPEQAILLLRRAVKLNPGESNFWHNLGVAYGQIGNGDEAANAFEAELRLRPNSNDLRRAIAQFRASSAFQCQKNRDFARAADLYRRAFETEKEPEYAYLLGKSLESAGDKKGAADAYKQALDLDPDNNRYQRALKRIEKELKASSPQS